MMPFRQAPAYGQPRMDMVASVGAKFGDGLHNTNGPIKNLVFDHGDFCTMTRWKASGIHLCLSILIIGGIALSAFLLWYPHGLYRIANLDRILLIMLGIDLTAGPLLTCIVYNRRKAELWRDLMVIALLQLGFLAYGLYTLWLSRPVFLVASVNAYDLVFANEIDKEDLALAPTPKLRRLSWTGPRLVGAKMPMEREQRVKVMDRFMKDGIGLERLPQYYVDYAVVVPELLRHSKPVQGAGGIDNADVRATGRALDQLRWLPINSLRGSGSIILDARSGEPLLAVGTAASGNP